jgi:hypothetical protein
MQRWEFLTVGESAGNAWLNFSHPQPASVVAMFPRSQKDSTETTIVIKEGSREVKEWRGPLWRRQVADLGWEPVGGVGQAWLFKRPME